MKKNTNFIVVVALLVLALAGWLAGVVSFFDEDRTPVHRLTTLATPPADRLEIKASIISIDPVRGTAKIELVFDPKGRLASDDRHKLTRDIKLHTNGIGKSDIVVHKNHQMHPVELTIGLLDGDFALYPMDAYNAELEIEVAAVEGESLVPLVMNFESHNHQMHAEAELNSDSGDSDILVDIKLQRTTAVKAFAWFMNAVMAMLGVAAVLVTFNVAYRGKKFETSLMIWMGALLFVLPGIRNMLPGTPPMGSFTDFLVFFWVEAAISVCAFIMVLTWAKRVGMEK